MLPTSASSPKHTIVRCNKPIKDDKQDEVLDLDQHPSELVDVALETLQSHGFQPVEWRALLYRRMGVPVLVRNFSFLVPDDYLERASDHLTRIGLPISPPNEFLLQVSGDLHAMGRFHRITTHAHISVVQHIILYPMSFSTLSPADLIEAPPCHIKVSRCSKILIPRPPALFASLIRMLSLCPRFGSTRTVLKSELSELIGYHLYGLRGFVDPVPGSEEEKDVDRRIQEAGQLVCQWSIEEEWRPGEEWIVDALRVIVLGTDGADMHGLPYQS